MIAFNFKWRSILLAGEPYPHGHNLLLPFWENFSEASIAFYKRFKTEFYIKTLTVPFMAIIFLMIKKSLKKNDLLILSLWVPLLLIHTLSGQVGLHYGAILSFPPLLLLWKSNLLTSSKKFKNALIALTLSGIFSFKHDKNFVKLKLRSFF